jgi:hypothetical protein
MKSVAPRSLFAILVTLFCVSTGWATPGIFRGTLVDPPTADSRNPGKFLYLQARNGAVRKVEISQAYVSFDDSFPQAQRKSKPQDLLKAGTDVRVTAEQAKDGEWHASLVEVLSDNSALQMSAPDDDDDEKQPLDPDEAKRAVLRI